MAAAAATRPRGAATSSPRGELARSARAVSGVSALGCDAEGVTRCTRRRGAFEFW